MSFDVLQEKIIRMKNPTVVGLDPKPEYVPEHIRKASYEQFGETLEGAADAIFQFNKGLIDALCDVVPAVKPQSAYYERLGWHGMAALEKTIRYAHEKGMYVIADIKRGDIGSTAEAYADAWLGVTKVGEAFCGGFNADCVTLNGYMGADSVNPFLKVAGERDKSVFILAKTSNPGSGELQNVAAGEGDTVYGLMADLIEKWGAGTEGKYGYIRAGAVAGATYPEELQKLRARMPHTFLLVPGYGAQGGTAEDVQYAFQENGRGAVVNSSRGIICAWQKTGKNGADYQEAARAAAIDHIQAGEGGRALGQLGADVLPAGEVQGGQQELLALEVGVRRRGHQGIARAVAVHPHAQPALSGRDGQRAVQARRSACGGVIGHPQALAAVVDVVQAGLGPVGGRAGGTEGGQVALTVLQRLDVARDTHRHGECLAPGGDGEVTAGALCPGGKDAVCVHRAHLWVR